MVEQLLLVTLLADSVAAIVMFSISKWAMRHKPFPAYCLQPTCSTTIPDMQHQLMQQVGRKAFSPTRAEWCKLLKLPSA